MPKLKLVVLLLMAVSAPAFATTRYVAPGGTNAGGCTSPCLTITYAIGQMAGGDTLLINDGVYSEALNVVIPDGSSGSPTIIKATHANQAIVRPPDGNSAAFWLRGGNYITIDGIDADCVNVVSNSCGPYLWNNNYTAPTHITLQHGTARNAKGQYGSGIELGAGGHHLIWDMDVIDNGTDSLYDHGIYVYGSNVTVDGNRVHGSAAWGIHVYHGCDGANGCQSTGIVISNNKIYSQTTRSAILLSEATGALIYNNVLYSNNGDGIYLYSSDLSSTKIYNNTIYGNGAYCIDADGATLTGSLVKNNICRSNSSGALGGSWSGTTCTYNLGVSGGESSSSSCSGTNTATNPSFVNAAGGDFHLSSTSSPAYNAGTDLSATFMTDFDGVSRPQAQIWDIGAFEFPSGGAGTSVRCSSTNTAASGTAASVSACSGTATGDLVVIVLSTNGTLTHSDNNGSTPFTKDLNNYQGSSSGTLTVWTRRILGGDPSTYNFTLGSSTRWTIHAITIQNPNLSSIYDGSIATAADGSGTLTTANASSITTSLNNSIHFAVLTTDGPSDNITSTPVGYTCQQNSGNQWTAVCTKTIATAGATGAQSFSWASASEYMSASFAIRDSGASGGTITHDTSGSGGDPTFSGTITISLTVANQPDRVLIMGCTRAGGTSSGGVNDANFNGNNLTQIAAIETNDDNDKVRTEMWKLVAPSTGTHNLTIHFQYNASYDQCGADVWYGVDQTTTNRTPVTYTSGTASAGSSNSLTPASAANDVVVDVMGWRYDPGTTTAGGSQTTRYSDGVGGVTRIGASSKPGAAGTTTMSWSWSTSGTSASHIAVALIPD